MRFIDAHNHLQDERLRPWRREILEACAAAGVERMVVNGACESDWDDVAALAGAYPGRVLPSFGWHPWWLHEQRDGWEERLGMRLRSWPDSGVGECGLDAWILEPGSRERLRGIPGRGDVAPAGVERQVAVLRVHLRWAAELDRPLSLHCLRAWGRMLSVLMEGPLPRRGFLLHSYGGPAEMVPAFVRMGAYFGFPGYFLHERKRAQRDVFRVIPPDRLLVESDAPDQVPPDDHRPHRLADGLNHPANVGSITTGLATALGMPREALAQRVAENFGRWWGG